MTTTDTRPYELLARFNPTGTVRGISVKTITTVNGRDYESDPLPIASATDPAIVEFAEQFSTALLAQRDQLLIEKAALVAERDRLQAENASLREQLAAAASAGVVAS